MMRCVASVSTEVLCTVTAPPLPGGHVTVTLTLVLGMTPAGKPVPVTVTLSPTFAAAGDVLAFNAIAAEATETLPINSANITEKEPKRRTTDIRISPDAEQQR